MRPRFLNKDEFAQVVRNTPLVAIDVIIRNPDQCVLIGLRTNEPAKGKWFVPGGVVRKNERLADALARIVKAEIGLEASIDDAKFVGVYEHLSDCNGLWGEKVWDALLRRPPSDVGTYSSRPLGWIESLSTSGIDCFIPQDSIVVDAQAVDHSDARACPIGDIEFAGRGTNRHALDVVHI